jgi:hypothetical protein
MSSSAQGVGNFTETENEEITSYFDLYRRLTYEKSVRRGTSLVVKSVSSVDNSNGPYKFDIPAQSNCYISLDQSRLHMRMKLVKANGEALSQSESEAITPVNNILHSIWDSITVGINDVDHVHLAQSRVGYKEVVENLLSYSEEGAAKQLSTQGWCHDKAEDMGTLISRRRGRAQTRPDPEQGQEEHQEEVQVVRLVQGAQFCRHRACGFVLCRALLATRAETLAHLSPCGA